MKTFLWIFSVLYVAGGLMFILAPDRMKKFYSAITKSINKLAPLAIIFGFLFLWAAPASSLDWLIRILGAIALIKGAFFLVFPKLTKNTINWWLSLPSKTYRAIGIVVLLLAWVVISSIL
jgi:uncharacterized protein YjeT (DUF2065 family)